MLRNCDTREWDTVILNYIGSDYKRCLYLYVDLRKFSCSSSMIDVWVDADKNKNIKLVMLHYHTAIHLYSKDLNFNIISAFKKINEIGPDMICATIEMINIIRDNFEKEYSVTYGTVGTIERLRQDRDSRVERAELNELHDIAKMIKTDEGLGGVFELEELELGLKERHMEGFSRNYVLREQGQIVCHVDTSAELNDIGIISGVITIPEHRGCGLAAKVLNVVCADLLNEGKEVFSFYYTPAAYRMHENVGFNECGKWAKLSRKKEG